MLLTFATAVHFVYDNQPHNYIRRIASYFFFLIIFESENSVFFISVCLNRLIAKQHNT